MAIKCKREKRRQKSLERAYWHVREVMQFVGCSVTEQPNVPTWVDSDTRLGKNLMDGINCRPLGVYVAPFVVYCIPGDHYQFREMVMHECCHACQPGIGDDSVTVISDGVPYEERPHEIEAFLISGIAQKLWCVPRDQWAEIVSAHKHVAAGKRFRLHQ